MTREKSCGTVVKQPILAITIEGKRIADLIP